MFYQTVYIQYLLKTLAKTRQKKKKRNRTVKRIIRNQFFTEWLFNQALIH